MEQGVEVGEVHDEGADFAWRERVRDANISDPTLLAAGYLNQVNEIIMLTVAAQGVSGSLPRRAQSEIDILMGP
jgi:hypothetical protein